MKHLTGFLLAYTLLVSLYALGLHTGHIASKKQACVQYDYVTTITEGK